MIDNLEIFQTYNIGDKLIITFENNEKLFGILRKFGYNADNELILGIYIIGDDEINWFHPVNFDYDIKIVR